MAWDHCFGLSVLLTWLGAMGVSFSFDRRYE